MVPFRAKSNLAVLFVHGAWSTPAFFAPITQELEARGIPASCPLLPTCDPSAVAICSKLDMHADAQVVEKELERLIEYEDKRVLLVCHSYGGIPGTQAARADLGLKMRQCAGLCGGIVGILYIAAFIVDPYTSLEDLNYGRPAPFVMEHDDGMTTTKDPEQVFFSDLEPEEAEQWASQLVSQTRRPHSTKLTRAGYKYHPTGYIVCEKDTNTALQEWIVGAARERGINMLDYHLPTGHFPCVSQPDAVADIMQHFAAAICTNITEKRAVM